MRVCDGADVCCREYSRVHFSRNILPVPEPAILDSLHSIEGMKILIMKILRTKKTHKKLLEI